MSGRLKEEVLGGGELCGASKGSDGREPPHDFPGIREVNILDWPLRLRIALGAVGSLACLHSSTAVSVAVVHMDFKSSTILLIEHFEAKILDFGLAKLMPQDLDLHTTTRVLGAFSYCDPEYALTGKLTFLERLIRAWRRALRAAHRAAGSWMRTIKR